MRQQILGLLALLTLSIAKLFAPIAGATWNIELTLVPHPSQADDPNYHVWDFDFAEAPKSTIEAFQAKGHPVICYFSAGTWEDWRKDADQFPKVAIGKPDGGWPGEKWLNISNSDVRAIMKQRILDAKAKGCDGVDPDNVEAWDSDTGFNLTKDDAVNYVHFLAKTANDAGMAFGLKNAGGIIDRVIDVSAWAVNEQCVQYDECEPYQAFIKMNKPVFHIEYTGKRPAPPAFVKKSCTNAHAKGFSTVIKHLNLNAWTTTCP